MTTWSIRFRGRDERDTLGKADVFYLTNKKELGLDREEFFARLLINEDGTEAAFVATAEPLWNARPDSGGYGQRPVGTEPAVGTGPRQAEIGMLGGELPSEGEVGWTGGEVDAGDRSEETDELRGSGPYPAGDEDSV